MGTSQPNKRGAAAITSNAFRFQTFDADRTDSFEGWATRPYLSDETSRKVRDATVLLLPYENFRGLEYPVFPYGTARLLRLLRMSSEFAEKAQLCCNENEFREVALYDDWVNIVGFLATDVALPLLLDILAEYIWSTVLTVNARARIRVQYTIEYDKKGRPKMESYKFAGPARYFSDACNEMKKNWTSSHKKR